MSAFIRFIPYLFLSLFLFGIAARAEKGVICEIEQTKDILVYQEDKETYVVTDFEFNFSLFILPAFGCQKLLTQAVLKYGEEGVLRNATVQKLFDFDGKKRVRLGGRSKEILHEICATTASCSPTFPFDVLANLRSLSQPPPHLPPKCLESPIPHQRAAMGDLPLHFDHQLHPWFTPMSSLRDQLDLILQKTAPSTVFLSTMSLSLSEARQISQSVLKYPQHRVFIFFSLNETIFDGGLWEIPDLEQPNLFWVPIFSSPTNYKYFHLKGIASTNGDFTLTSANLSRKFRQTTFDFGVSGESTDISASFMKMLTDIGNQNCIDLEYLACTMDSRYSLNQEVFFYPNQLLGKSCAALGALKKDFMSKLPKPVLHRNDTDDVKSVLLQKMSQAKRSLLVFTDHFDDPDIAQEMHQARRRKIDVRLYLGSKDRNSVLTHNELTDITLQIPENEFYEPHSKGILIDDEWLYWSSGNLTRNGLEDSMEWSLTTTDNQMLGVVRKYLNTIDGFIPHASFHFAERSKPDASNPPFIYLSSKSISALRRTEFIKSQSKTFEISAGLFQGSSSFEHCVDLKQDVFIANPFEVKSCLDKK